MPLEIVMTKMNLLPQKKLKLDTARMNDAEIHNMKLKLEDNEYIDGAIYKLASILTDRLINGGFANEEEKVQAK